MNAISARHNTEKIHNDKTVESEALRIFLLTPPGGSAYPGAAQSNKAARMKLSGTSLGTSALLSHGKSLTTDITRVQCCLKPTGQDQCGSHSPSKKRHMWGLHRTHFNSPEPQV